MRPLGILLAAAALLCACQKSAEDKKEGEKVSGIQAQSDEDLDAPLARVDDVVITVREFQERLGRKSPYARARYNSKEKKRELLEDMIRFEVLAKEAKARGFDRHPDVIRTMKQVMIQKLVKDEFKSRVKPEDISESELRAYYEEHKNEYQKPEEIRVAAIIVEDRAAAKKAARLALGEAGSTNKGFRDLVSEHSTDEESRKRGGDLRYFSPDASEIPAPVVEAAFELDRTGKVAGPIDAGDGRYYIIKQTGRRPAVHKSFEDVERRIRSRLYQEKRKQAQKDFLSDLRKKAKIDLYEEHLDKVRVEPVKPGEAPRRRHGHGHGAPEPEAPGQP